MSAVIAPRTVTTVSQKVMPLSVPSRSLMPFAAIGAQVPFSTRPTLRPWYWRRMRWRMYSSIFGKTPVLYVVVASTRRP